MGIEMIIGGLASGVARAMASHGWSAIRDRFVSRLADNAAERQRIAANLDACYSTANNRGEAAAQAQLHGLFRDYAESHPNADTALRNALTVLNGAADVRTDDSISLENSPNALTAGAAGQVARGNIHTTTNSHNTTGSHNTTTTTTKNTKKGGAGPVVGLLVLVILGLAFAGFVIGNARNNSDSKSPNTGVEESADPSGDGEVKTCGQWLRLPQSQGDTVARDIALRLGNREAAQDPFLVQNVQYNCGGVEDRKLAKVLAPRDAQ
ncbi:hypothetical protein [Streptomyces virginiae]|uniref:hypothetical protein n=1 Tax=Streptomyces virginiae TaxID=1961 RepID=UPI00365422F7